MRAAIAIAEIYRLESRRFPLWFPVCLGAGIWGYFALRVEPDPIWAALVLVPLLALLSGLPRRLGWGALVGIWGLFAVALGFSAALWSAHRADAPAVAFPIGETVEGRVIALSRSASGSPRMLLDRVVIYGIEPGATPERVRLTVLDGSAADMPLPGTRIRVYATLMPTGEPVEPGAFDFSRRAYFARLGGVGLTRGVVLEVPAGARTGPLDAAFIWLARVRDRISRYLRATLPGREGAFAAAIIVGDRSDIQEADAEALRASNLAHLLAISGLHMGILTGMVFAIVRLGLALVPLTAYAVPTKKAAAVAALLAGLAYLGLSGATVATQRAFIMVAVAFTAVLLDRPALSLRALAVAATVILLWRPISLLDAGFQMSFAATVALVAGYEEMRRIRFDRPRKRPLPIVLCRAVGVYVVGLLISSLLAGLSTAPIAAYHFNRTAPYGLLSNLLALPVMGLWIAPMACLSAVLAPLGLSELPLQAMGAGIEQVLRTAHWVGGLPGAVQPVHAAPGIVLGLIAIGGLWLMLWRGPWRFAGIAGAALGLHLWQDAPPRPDLLVAPQARLIGVMTGDGRVLDHEKAQSFAAKTWLRRDGDGAEQVVAAARPGLNRAKGHLSTPFGTGWTLHVRWGRGLGAADLQPLCREKTLLIAKKGPDIEGPCRHIGPDDLQRLGAFSVTATAAGLRIEGARNAKGRRIWDR